MTRYKILVGDVQEVSRDLEGFDAVVSDPPYGLSFMGKGWDHSVPSPDLWRSVYGALKPGAHLFAFGGTRQYHRLVCGIEDAGFEVRDALMWLYGSGFPKSHNVSKAIGKAAGAEREVVGPSPYASRRTNGTGGVVSVGFNGDGGNTTTPATPHAQTFDGYGTALKPAYEPICMARKPLGQSVADNAIEHNTGALNIDGARIGTDDNLNGGSYGATAREEDEFFRGKKPGGAGLFTQPDGRWPANVVMDAQAGEALDAQSGSLHARGNTNAKVHTGTTSWFGATQHEAGNAMDAGGASRFFYCAKASREEREAGLHGFTPQIVNDGRETSIDNAYQRGDTKRRNIHPTVKPVDLIRWLATLALPPKREGFTRRVLVPFSGSGSEMIGCLLAGWDEVVGIEINPDYAAIALARLAHWQRYRCASSEAAEREADGQEVLF